MLTALGFPRACRKSEVADPEGALCPMTSLSMSTHTHQRGPYYKNLLEGVQADGVSVEQVEPQEKKKTPKGRAKKRITYTRRFVNVTMTGGKRKV